MYEVLKAIADRRSIRSYTDEPVSDEMLKKLIDAAEQAPSAMNRQPIHFTFVRDKAILKAFSDEARAHLSDPSMDILRGSKLVCFLFAEIPGVFTPIDAGIAVENLALASHDLGLGSVILGMPREAFTGDRAAYWYETLHAPVGSEFAIAIGIGHPAASKEAHPVREGLITIL